MKRSRETEKNSVAATKNELTTTTMTTPKKPKIVEVSVFEWLPLELFQKILDLVPWQLDGVLRLVHSTWYGATDRRWAAKKRPTMPSKRVLPCVRWGLQNHAFGLLEWMALDLNRAAYAGAPQTWMGVACRAGNTKTIAWLVSQAAPDRVRTHEPLLSDLYDVARYGDVHGYRILFDLSGKGQPNPEDMHQACVGGNMEIAKWIMSQYNPKDWPKGPYTRPRFRDCVKSACYGGHLRMVGWLLTTYKTEVKGVMFGPTILRSEFIETAVVMDHLPVAQYLLKKWNCPMNQDEVFERCMQSCRLKTIQWAMHVISDTVKLRHPWRLRHFVMYRHFEVLDVLMASNKMELIIDTNTFNWAIRGNGTHNLAMIQWLWRHCDKTAIRTDMGGLLSIIGKPVESMFEKVLMGGHLDVLQWLYDHGLGWFSSQKQAKNFRQGILKSLGRRCQLGPDGSPNAKKSKAVLFWLHQHGVVDLSQARILANGNVWFHLNCQHQRNLCLELKRYWASPQSAIPPWKQNCATGTLFYSPSDNNNSKNKINLIH